MPPKARSETAPPPPAVPAPAGDEGDLPEGWAVAKLAEIGSWCSGGTPSRTKPEFFGKGIPWVKSGDLPDGPIEKTDEQITQAGLDNSAAKLMPAGTICMALYGATIGKLGVMTFPAATNQATANLVPDARLVDRQFVFQYLMSERERFIDLGQGGAQPNISQEIVRNHPITLPPLAEQRRIVGVLEGLLGKVAASRERLARVPQLLKRFRQSVLAAACSGKLTADWREENPVEDAQDLVVSLAALRESLWNSRTGGSVRRSYKPPFISGLAQLDLPSTWQEVTVSQLALLDVGHAFKSAEFETDGIRLLRGENLEPGRLRWTDTRYWPADKLSGLEHLLVEEGEIILALDRPVISTGLKIARATKADLPCALVQRMMRFKLVDERVTPWLFYNLNLPAFIEHLSAGLTGSDIPHVTGTGVAEYVVALPPLAEQHEIVRRVEQLFALADRLEAQLDAARKRVDRLTQSILAKAFRGELVPTEADLARREGRTYEPASQLLARIREQQTAAAGSKSKGLKSRKPKSLE